MTTERPLNEPEPAVYRVPEVATLLRVDRRTIVRMLERGELRGIRVGRDWRILRKSVEALMAGEPPAPVVLTPKALAPATTRRKAAKGKARRK